jgi:hypothetical protein
MVASDRHSACIHVSRFDIEAIPRIGMDGKPTDSLDNNVTDQKRHLTATDGSKGASVAQELMMLAEKNHDQEGAFTGTKYASNDTPTHKGAK